MRENKTTVLTGEGINFAQLAVLKAGLKLETAGMRRSRGPSCLSQLRSLGYKGTRKRVLEQVERDVASAIREKQERQGKEDCLNDMEATHIDPR